jgi:hypothetical protein
VNADPKRKTTPILPPGDRVQDEAGRPPAADLDRFFQAYAGQNQVRHHIGTTYVAVEGAELCGCVTVSRGKHRDRPGLSR